jgi:hypothetical protein
MTTPMATRTYVCAFCYATSNTRAYCVDHLRSHMNITIPRAGVIEVTRGNYRCPMNGCVPEFKQPEERDAHVADHLKTLFKSSWRLMPEGEIVSAL